MAIQKNKQTCTVSEKEHRQMLMHKLIQSKGLELPEEFDCKKLMYEYYKYYEGFHLADKKYADMLEKLPQIEQTDDPITRWYLYRTLDESYQKNKRFDCDSWNETNDWMNEVYDRLWRDYDANLKKSFSGDTMNSFATTFDRLARRGSYEESFKMYHQDPEFREKARGLLGEYARRVGWIGNFTLVPHAYSGYRGSNHHYLNDYWDLSLDNLKYDKDEKNWLNVLGEDKKDPFRRYVNTFFLWDYVTKDFEVTPLVPSHKEKMGEYAQYPYQNPYPEENEFKIFTDNVNARILRRGIFMVAMLRIATNSECKDDYASKIVPVLSTSAYLGSMKNIVTRLALLQGLSEETKRILNEIVLPSLPYLKEDA